MAPVAIDPPHWLGHDERTAKKHSREVREADCNRGTVEQTTERRRNRPAIAENGEKPRHKKARENADRRFGGLAQACWDDPYGTRKRARITVF